MPRCANSPTNENVDRGAKIQAECQGGQVWRGLLLRSRQREGPDASLCVQRVLYGDEVNTLNVSGHSSRPTVVLKLSPCRRSKFVGDCSIHCYEVQWEPSKLSWESFRGELLGPTDPKDGKFYTKTSWWKSFLRLVHINNASFFPQHLSDPSGGLS